MATNSQKIESLQQEVERLREQVAKLEQEREDIRERYQWMEDLLEQCDMPICLWHGPDKIYKYANSVYLNRSGKLDAIGKPIREVFLPHEIPGLLPVLDRAYASGEMQVVPEALIHIENPQTGQVENFWFNLIYNPVRNAQGEVIGVSNFAVDVTEQVRARQELHRQAQILEQVRGSVIVTNMEGIIISWNKASTHLYGYAPEEMIGRPTVAFYPVEVRDRLFNELMRPVQEQGKLEIETTGTNKAGQVFPIQLSLSLLRDDGGEPIGIISYSIDNSERKRQESELRIFKAMIENAPDGFALADMDGKLRYLNPAYYTTLGYDEGELIGQPLTNHLDEAPNYIGNLVQQVTSEGLWQGELTYKHANGTLVPGLGSSFIVYDAAGQPLGLCGIFRDITEQKRAGAERTALQEQVIEAQRAALRELSAPLLPFSNHAMILPLIGSVDTQRAQQIMETLLEGVAQHQADIVIVDITGVQVVDTQVANALIQTAQAVQLLGARVVLTGIGPAMAQTLIHLGADLSNIVTLGTLQSGIAYAMKQGSKQDAPRSNGGSKLVH